MVEEPVKPKSRSRKPQPSSLSLFEWALTLWSRNGRRRRSARGARPQDTGGGHHDAVSSPCWSMYAGLLLSGNHPLLPTKLLAGKGKIYTEYFCGLCLRSGSGNLNRGISGIAA